MKVLYLNPTVSLGGGERSLLELISGVDRKLVEPMAACISEGPLTDALRKADVKVAINSWPSFALRIGRGSAVSKLLLPLAAIALVPHVFRLASLIRRHDVRIVHTNGIKSHVIGSMARLLTGCKLVWHVRDVLAPGLTRILFNNLARMTVTCLVANSKTVFDTFDQVDEKWRRIIYNGLDTTAFSSGDPDPEVKASLGIQEGDFVIGALGALSPLKGHIHLIRSVPEILKSCPNARVVILGQEMAVTVGHEGYKSLLQAEIDRLGVADRVLLAGYRENPVSVMRCLDVLAHCSVYPESFGRVLVEAMACGVPVVATALGGPTEIIVEEDQGILIPPEDPSAIAQAVIRLHSEPDLRKSLAKGGRTRVVSAFNRERYIHEVEEAYRVLAS